MTETSNIMKKLGDGAARRQLLVLREKVKPILEINLLHHYTDHSVMHSDNMTRIIDALIDPIQDGADKLTEQELGIVYAACYLHDVGMNWEKSGDLHPLGQAGRGLPRLPSKAFFSDFS
jgi:hypothetical protein